MTRPSTLPADPDRSPEVDRALAWLQAEQNAAESPAYTSMLLHEAAVVLEGAGDEQGAQRQYRAALSLEPHFREPLEQLLALYEGQGRLDELTELYRHLRDTSSSNTDRSRALLEGAALELERTADFEAAKAALREVTDLCPADATPWLMLDLLGHRTGDNALREEALLARLGLTNRPLYRGLLLLDVAELRNEAGDTTKALALLEEAAALETPHSYPALVLATKFALQAGRPRELERVLGQRLRLIDEAENVSSRGDDWGVPHDERLPEARAYLHLLRSLALKSAGDSEAATQALAAAYDQLPTDLVLLYLRYAEAEQRQDHEQFRQAGQALATRLAPTGATWCWLKLAINRLQQADDSGALDFVQRGLAHDTRSLPLRALDVHLALKRNDGQALAIALEAISDCFTTDETRAAWLLAAASIWALRARHAIGAKAALAQASLYGLPPSVCHHTGRLLAQWVGDPAYYEESTRRAQALTTDKFDRLDLGLELLRLRLASGDRNKTNEVITTLLSAEDSAFVGQLAQLTLSRWLRRTAKTPSSFELTNADTEPSSEAPSSFLPRPESVVWEYLAERCEVDEMATALRSIAAVTDLNNGEPQLAATRFAQLAERQPDNLVWAMARVTLALSQGDVALSTRILRQTAEATADPTVRSTLALQGAILGTSANCLDDVCTLLDLATLTHPESVDTFTRWVLRTVSLGNPQLRHRVLSASTKLGHPTRRALERFALELLTTEKPDRPTLTARVVSGQSDPLTATATPGQQGAVALLALLHSNELVALGESAVSPETKTALKALAAAVRYADVWYKNEAHLEESTRLSDARAWAEVDPSLLAQLEWLLVARSAGDSTDEARARTTVAAFLGPKEAETLAVGAQQLSYLFGEATPPLLPSTSAAARFANLEVSPPGCDPRRRATALEEAADLQGPNSALLMRVNLGFNWIACGDYERARTCFAELIEARPRFIPAWLGLRTIAERKGDPALLAEACAALGDLLENPQQAALEWERAATLLLDELGDNTRGKLALTRVISLDITRNASFNRLFRLVREAALHQELLSLIDARLPHVEHDEERILLLWERARTLRTTGDRPAALIALDAVTRLTPNHVGALALAGEIHIALGQFDEAARFLSQLSRLEAAPLKQRLMGAMAAADLFDKKLGRPAFARDILLELYRQGHAPALLRERLAQLAIKVDAPDLAVELLESLFLERPTPESRVEIARLTLALCRDTLKRPERAKAAVECLLTELPADAEAIDLVLTGCFTRSATENWLSTAQTHLRDQLQRTPLDPALVEQLAHIAGFFEDLRTRQACLGALIAMGAGTPAFDAEITQLDERLEHLPTIAIDDIALEAISDPEDQGPIAELFAQFAAVFTEALGPTLTTLGVGKKQRVDPRLGLPLRNEIVAWAGAFGIPEFDLYLADQIEGDVIAVATERPSVVVAGRLTAPLDLYGRQAVARELFALRRGLSLLRHRSLHELTALIAAACQVGEHPLTAPAYAMKDEFVRLLTSALPRKLRKLLQERAFAIQQSNDDPGDWLRAATHSLDRIAALASGDASQVLAHITGQRGRLGVNRDQRDRAGKLVAFVVSPSYLELKDTLGLAVR